MASGGLSGCRAAVLASRCLNTISSMVLFEYALGAVLFATFAVVAIVFYLLLAVSLREKSPSVRTRAKPRLG